MARLHLHATEAALLAAIERSLEVLGDDAASALELGRGITSLPRLLEDAASGPPAIGTLAETLLLRELASLAERSVSLALGLRGPIAAMRRAGISPSALRAIAGRTSGRPREEARALASALDRYEQLLGGRIDGAARTRGALQRIASAPIAALQDVTEVELHGASPSDPLQRALIEALSARGLTVRCRIADAPPPLTSGGAASYEEALADAARAHLDALEAIHAPHVERAREELGAGPMPLVLHTPAPQLEARELARRVRDRIHAGVAPDEIAIVAQDPAARVRLVDALRDYAVPAENLGRARALQSGATRAAVSIYRVVEEGMPRDGLADLMASRYLAGETRLGDRIIRAGRVARALREALPVSATHAELRPQLLAWVGTQKDGRRDEAEAIARHVFRFVDLLTALPARATLARHARAAHALFEELELFTRARGFRAGGPPHPGDEAGAALARDQAALRVLSDRLAELPRAAARAGLAERSYTRAEFAEVLAFELAAARLPPGGARGGAVLVCDLADLPPRRWSLLVLSGVSAGVVPVLVEDDVVLSDALRDLFNRALDRVVLPLARDEERRLRLVLASARAAAEALIVSCARVDLEGRPLDGGELLAHARAMGAVEERPHMGGVPVAEDARSIAELVARLQLEEHGDLAARQGLTPADLTTLRAQLTARVPGTMARIDALAGMERHRAAFFRGEQPPSRHEGRLPGAASSILPGRAERPLSATTLARYGECPHRFFLEAVLRLRSEDELSDELDDLDGGMLKHLALERLFTRWRDAGLFPLSGRSEESAEIGPALDEALARWTTTGPRGHELVFRARERNLRALLERVWRAEVEAPPAPGLTPTHLELPFDQLEVAGGPPGSPPVFLRGSVDRVDVAGTRAAVFDYKSGRLQGLKPDLKEDAWGVTSWQLPIYAAVVRERLSVEAVDMGYYSLREIAVDKVVATARLTFAPGTTLSPTLGTQLWSLVLAMREGRFDVVPEPGACDRCRMQAVCRIDERRDDEDEVAG